MSCLGNDAFKDFMLTSWENEGLDIAHVKFVDDKEDGHMDFRLNNTNPLTRIIKIYIWSDHQATMIDDYSERDYQYTSRFDITGELQAKEHIVPGGLEVRIGNEDKSQHAIVVSSKDGAVSYVNAVDGFKLPGVTKNEDTNQIEINFNLGGNNKSDIHTTGTFYKFMPLESGTMQVKFTAYSMYYYRYDINGNAIYYDNGRSNVRRNVKCQNGHVQERSTCDCIEETEGSACLLRKPVGEERSVNAGYGQL